MEQTTSTTTAPATPAITAAAGLLAITTSAPSSGAETDIAAQFSALLDAIKVGATPAPPEASEASEPAAEQPAETSDDGAPVATPDATAAAATLVVPAALVVSTQLTLAVPVSISAHARGTKSGEATVEPVITDTVVPAEAGAPAPAPLIAAAPAAATVTEPVAAIVLPSSPAPPDGDVDPALVEAAIAAAIESAPAKPAGATTKATARVAPTAEKVAAEGTTAKGTTIAESTAEPQVTAVAPAPTTTTDQPVTAAEPAPREGGSPSTSGHGGRLDLQVQAAPTRPAAPDAVAETPVAIIDRERVERLADGLAARLKVSHAADGARIRMQLEPRELGEVVVRLEIRNGMAHAHLIAESADAGTALQASLADLRSSLADRGLQLESVSIRVAGEGAANTRDQTGQPQGDRRSRAPLSFGRIDPAATIAAATDQIDRAREGQAVWMLA